MTRFSKLCKLTVSTLMLVVVALASTACETSTPIAPADNDKDTALVYQPFGAKRAKKNVSSDTPTAETGTVTLRYYKRWNEYQGGKIALSQGSMFEVPYGALTPPADLHGQNVTISMTVVQTGSHELVFEFGPHGSQFDPPATIWFRYDGPDPHLYYIQEDGTRVEQQPDDVDMVNQWLKIKVHHFSRYALAWSN